MTVQQAVGRGVVWVALPFVALGLLVLWGYCWLMDALARALEERSR